MDNRYEQFKGDVVDDRENDGGHFPQGQKVRLRALESESTYFLKLMNVGAIRLLTLIQVITSAIILLSQILMYATSHTRYYKVVDFLGMGIWAPLLFFSVAGGLAYLAVRYPSGCMIGTAMGFQITSIIFGLLLLLFAVISLIQHGYYSYGDNSFNSEVPGRVFCSFMILSAAGVIITAIFISVHFCRAVCCGRQRIAETLLFDVETVK